MAREQERPTRRHRLGPSSQTSGWSPFITHSTQVEDTWREHEIEQLERALADRGEMSRRELGQVAGCKYWGPGRFGAALRDAVRQGRIRRVGRGRYAPADDG